MLRPTFLSFETARKSITAAQFGLDTVGHNTANINTPGYSRQRVDQVSFALGGTGRFAAFGKQLPGQGVLVTGINRVRDPFLDNRYRLESTNYGETGLKNFTLREINRIFDEIEEPGLNAKLAELNDAFLKLQQSPSSGEHSLVVRTYTQQFAQMMNKYAKDINNVETQLFSDFSVELGDMNNVLGQIAFLNEKIFQQHVYGNPANEMMDERDLLFDKLSNFTDIVIIQNEFKVSNSHSVEQIEIRMNGLDGPVLVNHTGHAEFRLPEDRSPPSVIDSDPYSIEMLDSNGNRVTTNAGRLFEKGAIRGYLDMLNGKGNFAVTGENGVRGIPYYREAFDQLAVTFVREMNWANAADSDVFKAAFDLSRLLSGLPNVTPAQVDASITSFRGTLPPDGVAGLLGGIPNLDIDAAQSTAMHNALDLLSAAVLDNPPDQAAITAQLGIVQGIIDAAQGAAVTARQTELDDIDNGIITFPTPEDRQARITLLNNEIDALNSAVVALRSTGAYGDLISNANMLLAPADIP
ncbi:MAG: flagellar hook-associated protein FlgK, partial [Oscillospiraceae bacterium]|nr:flagellar hook-associated protein FlgK [Oscillospiraceae bacterium]